MIRRLLVMLYYEAGKLLATRYAPSEVDMFDFQRRFGDVADIFQKEGKPVTITWNDPASERFAAGAFMRLQGRQIHSSHSHVAVLEQYAIPKSTLLGVVYTYRDSRTDESIGMIKHAADRLSLTYDISDAYILRVRPFGVAKFNGNYSQANGQHRNNTDVQIED